MSTDDIRIESLVFAIQEAFHDASFPGDDRLLHTKCYDDHDIKQFYGMTNWKEVPAEVIEYENAALCFFSPEAFQFYLPAYLIWTLRNYRTSRSFTIDSTIYALDHDPGHGLDRFAQSKFSLFSDSQRQVVTRFLEHMLNQADRHCDREMVERILPAWNHSKTNDSR